MKKIKILQKKRGLISMQNKTLRDSSVGMIKFVRVLYSAIAIIFLFIAFLFIAISENPVGIIFMLLAVVFFRVANQCKKILKEKNQAEVAPRDIEHLQVLALNLQMVQSAHPIRTM